VLALVAATAAAVAVLVLVLVSPAGRQRTRAREGPSAVSTDSATGFAGAAVPGLPAHGFTLRDQSGARVSLSALRGQVIALAFLSPSCGPPCALIAQQIRGALDELAHPAAVLLVSVDPASDAPAQTGRFLAQVALAGRARYLSGSRRALSPIWRAYRVTPLSAGRGEFERAATVTLIDRAGRVRVIFGLEQLTPEGLAHDIRKLSSEGAPGGR